MEDRRNRDARKFFQMIDTELYKKLHEFADPDTKLPLMDTIHFRHLTERYTKEVFRYTLAEYIVKEKPRFPLKIISHETMRKSFLGLCNFDIQTICTPKDELTNDVVEKYDYKYPFSQYGQGLIEGPSTYNDASNYFHQALRLSCGSYGFRSPFDVWVNGTAKDVWRCFGPIWRGINTKSVLNEGVYVSAFRLGTYIATQFKPVVAKAIYDMTNAKTVLDTSCGWGDRLCGFYASGANVYIGCDPNPNTYERYKLQAVEYERLLGNNNPTLKESKNRFRLIGNKRVMLFRCGAEDLPWDKLPLIDTAFTSPPYFSTERYNEGGEHQDDQSWHKFTEYDMWRDNFFLPVAEKSMKVSEYVFVNIMDPQIKGVRYYSSDELVDRLQKNFVGQIGMRIMRRPKSDTLFQTEEDKRKHATDTFIENVWCFAKDPTVDLFKDVRTSTLETFFA